MTLETMKELFGVAHIRDDEQHMSIREEEVLLSQPITIAVMPKEEKVPIPHGLAVTISPQEEDVPVPLQGPLSWYHQRKKSHRAPPYSGPTEGRGGPSPVGPPIAVPPDGRKYLVTVDDNGSNYEGPVQPLVSSSPFFFLKNTGDSSHPFSHKCGRFVE
jgi:hypothetical protein